MTEFCHEHFSWLCQAGQGECQRAEIAGSGQPEDVIVVDHGPVKPPYGSPERAAYDAAAQNGGE